VANSSCGAQKLDARQLWSESEQTTAKAEVSGSGDTGVRLASKLGEAVGTDGTKWAG